MRDFQESNDMVSLVKGQDYATINGLSYHLKECGCDTTMGYDKGNHTLMVRRDFLPLAIDTLKNTCDPLGQNLAERLEQKHFKKMKKNELKEMIREELRILREDSSTKPIVNPKKANGIILGAVKTLFNSNAITGVDPTRATDIANELVKHIQVAIAPYSQDNEPQGDDLNDESAYKEEEDSLDDQSQYDPDLSKQTSDYEPKSEVEDEEESLFEVRKIAKKLKI
jgi:hypothetical protein